MALRSLLRLGAALGLFAIVRDPVRTAGKLPFRDPSVPLDRRVDDLLGRLTPRERISLLHQYQPAIARLGVASFKTGTEALHGVAWSMDVDAKGATVTARGTVFPQAVGLASTWDPALLERVGSVVGDEVRGYHAENPRVWGLNVWAPVVNPLRDPRWGRNEEGYSEDPTLTAAMAVAYATGLRGEDPDHLKTAPTLKHYLANNNEVRRDTTSAGLRPRVEHEYERPAFEAAVAADAATGVMASYNLVNGRPATVNPGLNTVVRSWTGRDLLNVTDSSAPSMLAGPQAYLPDLPHAYAAALKAGVDVFTTEDTDAGPTVAAIDDALAQGLITEADVDTAVRHILSIRFRLGEFDPGGGRYGSIGKDVVDGPEHRRLARRAASAAMVLLKNAHGALPLSAATTRKVAVVGPLAGTIYTDWYSGGLPYRVTPVDGIRERLGDGAVVAAEGADRVALRNVATGRYVTAGGGPDGAALKEGPAAAGDAELFDVFDWGQGVLTLRSVANGRYVGYDWTNFVNDQEQPNGWFVQQQFKLEPQDDGTFLLRYAGYEAGRPWFGPKTCLAPDDDGTLVLTTADQAARFARETVTSGVEAAVAAAKAADVAVVVVGSMPFINGREEHDRTDLNLAEGQHELVRAVAGANPDTVLVLQNSYPTTINWEQEHVPAILWTTHAGAETGNALADVLFGDVSPAGRLTQTWPRSADDLPDILDYDVIKARATYMYSTAEPLYPFGHGLGYTTFAYEGLELAAGSVGPGGVVEARVTVANTGAVDGDEVVQLYTRQRSSRVEQPLRRLRAFRRVHLRAGERATVTLAFPAAELAFWDVTRGRWVVESAVHDVMAGASSADIRRTAALEVAGETIPPRDLSRVTRAADFDDYRGVVLVDETKAGGDAVGGTGAGDWICFAGADLRAGATGLTARVAATAAGAIEVRLGSPGGTLAGTAEVPATGGVYSYRSVTAPLVPAPGVHDVYLVFTGDLRISDFSLSPGEGR
ncbi:glycoside hydrolase family 3 protein [Sphaerisporangium sp. TRM90804]|uniref:glycoside hydrolase family 3 protein n=1 Tax=Sphaerisporangium sp. TRM90804 TaxID=3031113 RepID=UPI002448CEC6|nr:glycoside hydrolase family 3 protein [Sphaerisporangium sp. TRM90804]MDH2428218.1 glycoside hydrolase family 3 C-terminal domain-containing protein [Sphaerisporangium sp. TRM90804]